MKKKKLEMILQNLPPLAHPKPHLEQYTTPAPIAAEILYLAYAKGDIQDKIVVDLGCGNGIFTIGASLLGSRMAIGVDADPMAIRVAKVNAERVKCDAEFILAILPFFHVRADTVIQNPPFGAQKKGADRPFLATAMNIADVVYSMHLYETADFVTTFVRERGWKITFQKVYKFEIPWMFSFHKKEKKEFKVLLMRIAK
ncbi:MAG: METTL5 family protein [Methanomassiliicoccales archaeon]